MIYKIYITNEGIPATGLTPTWESLYTISGTDKTSSAPTISEVGGGYYKFEMSYGDEPFTAAELVGVIDAGSSFSDYERYIPVEISLRDYALYHLTNKAVWDDTHKYEVVYNDSGAPEIKFTLSEVGAVKTRNVSGA